ncbi:MAG TPA: flagellar protein FlaG [Candidatus Hydrogenedentes bacterium]|nr:flagellar protein FlaG [Candidatus Hydrogenedentota bacterium]
MGVQSVNGQGPQQAPLVSSARAPRPQRDTQTVSRDSQQPQRGGLEPDSNNKAERYALFRDEKRANVPEIRSTRIHVDPETKRIVAQILDGNNEVIRQVPPEELLDIVAKSREVQGLLFDQKA